MDIAHRVDEVRAQVAAWRDAGERVGLVPTMGALHAGHLSLIQVARRAGAGRVVVSIFVNPTQFGPGEDLAAYPRDLDGDLDKLAAAGADLVFTPSAAEVYPPGAETYVMLEQLPRSLCGRSRPAHFQGVATVVTCLLNIVGPDLAVFGEKDFQQLRIIQRLVADLFIPVRIVGAPIVREPDGLAMSSRNAYLGPDDRARAVCLSRALRRAVDAVAGGETDVGVLRRAMTAVCEAAGGRVDYAQVVDAQTLAPLDRVDRPARALLAVVVGPARLIDNCALGV